MLIQENRNREIAHIPAPGLRGVIPVEIDLLKRSGHRKAVRGWRVNDLSPMPPASYFRDVILDAARSWVWQMDKRGFRLDLQRNNEGDIRVWGPYHNRDWSGAGRSSEMRAVGWSEGQVWDNGMTDFLLVADFVADYGQVQGAGVFDQVRRSRGRDVLQLARDYDEALRDVQAILRQHDLEKSW